MFVHNDPMPVMVLAQTHGEAKIQWLALAGLVNVYAVPDGRNKGDVTSGSHLQVGEIERHGLLGRTALLHPSNSAKISFSSAVGGAPRVFMRFLLGT
jgi:hypothetical protein